MIKNQSILKNQVVNQGTGNFVSDMGGEKVMLNIENGKYYNLGEVGGEIWEMIREPIAVQDLVIKLVADYNVNQIICEEQVISFLNLLFTEGLIQAKGAINS